MTAGYGFLRKPVWVGGAVLAVAAAAVFVRLGVWQLDRHDERRAFNASVAEAAARPAAPLESVLAGGEAIPEYRPASAAGSYVDGTTLLLVNRSYRGSSGFHVITALDPGDGAVVAIDRGWVPLGIIDEPGRLVPPPSGPAVVEGRVRDGRAGAVVIDPSGGLPTRVDRVDLDRLAELWGRAVAPAYLELTDQRPPPVAGGPIPADPPALGSGPHLGYAFQWFAFAVIAVGGFAVLAYRTARRPPPAERPVPEVARPGGLG